MDMRSIAPATAASDLAVRSAYGRQPAVVAPGGMPSVPRDKEPTPPPGLIGSKVMVEFGRHEGTGAEVVRFVDKETGELLNQMPAEQVLDAVTNLMKLIHGREA